MPPGGRVSVPTGDDIPKTAIPTFMSSNPWAINFPQYDQPVPASKRRSDARVSNAAAEQTVLSQAAQALSAHSGIRVCLCTGESVRSSMPTDSPLTEEALRFAAHKAGYSYGHQPLLGPRLCPARIQRLVLGVAELLQAELLHDPDCGLDQLDVELRAVSRCLCAGFQHLANHGAPDASASDDTERDNDAEGDDDNQ